MTPEEIAHRYYGLKVERVFLQSRGEMNKNYKLTAPEGDFFLRKRNPYFTEDSTSFELNLLNFLYQKNFSVPKLIKTRNNTLYVKENNEIWEL